VKDDDFVDQLFVANTHDYILCFSSRGRLYWLKVYEVPEGTRNSRGKPIVNLFPLLKRARRSPPCCRSRSSMNSHFVFMSTAHGHGQEDAPD
jgi:DNA gyrase subunit A